MKNCENNFKSETEELINIKEGCGFEVAIDNDAVEIILDQHGKQLDKYDMRITKLEDITTKILITNAENSVKLSNIENSQLKIEKRLLEYSNEQKDFQENLINKLIEKDTQIEVKKTEGKSKIQTQTIITVGAILTSLIAGAVSIYTIMHQVVK